MTKVYAMTEDQYEPGDEDVDEASSRKEAAKLIRKHIAEETGDGDTGITEAFVTLSETHKAYFLTD